MIIWTPVVATARVVIMGEPEDTLRRLALQDEQLIRSVLDSSLDSPSVTGLDAKTYALVRLSVLMCLGAPDVSYQSAVTLALAAGATTGDLVDTLKAVAPIVGCPRLVAAAVALALAIGYDIDAALEEYDDSGTATANHQPGQEGSEAG
jgi:4-carboxymuconolactone decarboxylase